ncbi:MAG: hypothetical protein AAGE52_24385 [Myxococcota bacterium]
MRVAISFLVLSAVFGCGDDDGDPGDAGVDAMGVDGAVDSDVPTDAGTDVAPDAGPADPPEICVGIRGNGPRITAHFGSLSRIIEHYGVPVGGAGGSSGSITLFFLESVAMNPLIETCGDGPCDPLERANRAALMFKSILGYLEVLLESEEALSFGVLADIIMRVQDEGIAALLDTSPSEAVDALEAILSSDDLRSLVNPEVLQLLADSPNPVFHARDIVGALASAASFEVTDDTILLRPGVLSFPAFAQLLGRIASFYAAYEPVDQDAMESWLSDCASPGRGMLWPMVAELPSGESTCGEVFRTMVTDYRAAVRADEESFPTRADDPVGGELRVLVSTSVMVGDAVTAWEAARADYLQADEHTFSVDFDDIRFGYWGQTSDLNLVTGNPNGYPDLKTSKALSLGEATWREVLAFSPAEPGLARALELPGDNVSAGGWSDLQPTLVLQNLGCEKVVYLTRQGTGSSFASGVARLLGADDTDIDSLFSFTDATSSTYLSIEQSDGIWCTDWDTPPTTDIGAITLDSYTAPLETDDPVFESVADPYGNITGSTGLPGCTLGVDG